MLTLFEITNYKRCYQKHNISKQKKTTEECCVAA